MVKRRRSSLWGSAAFQKSMTALTRSAWRAGSQVVGQAVKAAIKNTATKTRASTVLTKPKPKPKPRPPPKTQVLGLRPAAVTGRADLVARPGQPQAMPGTMGRGIALGPAGARSYQLYRPPGLNAASPAPLLVMLHGCGQTADAFALSTRMNRLAAREGFCVLYPEQDRRAHPQGCWNWYATRSQAAYAEAATLLGAIDQAALRCPIDLGRVAVAGFSAGAGMAALMASRYPARFRAVVMHSGVPPGVAQSSATALGAMLGTRRLRATTDSAGATWPPLLVIHGTADSVVSASNGRSAAALWAASAGAKAAVSRVLRRGQRHAVAVTDYRLRGRTVARLCEIDGLAHAWSGGAASVAHGDARGPDASRMVLSFVAKQFAAPPRADAGG